MAESYTIQISTNLIDKLDTNGSKAKKKNKKPKPKASEEPKQPDSKSKPASTVQTNSQSGGWPLQSPVLFPVVPTPVLPAPTPVDRAINAELEAIRSVLSESERVKEKLEKLESNMTKELTERAKELRDKEFKLPYQNLVPCTAEREACLNCYKEHSKNPLKCADVVKRFSNCASQVRQASSSVSQ